MKKQQIIFLFILLCSNPFSFAQSIQLKKKDLKEVVSNMAGSFSSEAQAKSDTDFYEVHLNMVQFWKNNKNGYWLYVEQALVSALDKPYRQRVYHVYLENDTVIASKVYELKNTKQYIGAWNNLDKLKKITNDSLVDRQGCAIYLRKNTDGTFSGKTPGKECLSSLRGATYATSEVTIYKDKIISWDRGWDRDNLQVWGAKKGAYVFIKQKQ